MIVPQGTDLVDVEALRRCTRETSLEVDLVLLGLERLDARLEDLEHSLDRGRRA